MASLFPKQKEGETFNALSSIDLTVYRRDRVGVIGNNGSGKSTLLRVVAGLYQPTSGAVEVRGDRTLLAGLGVGMLDELSVEQNIFLYGAMHNVTRQDLRDKFDEILRWAELIEFRHAALKTLSTGMRSRLAFSVMRYFTSDIYLLDEALSAGDRVFQEKCEDVFLDYERTGRTMLIATHDLLFVEAFCNKALWLQKGKQMSFGAPEEVIPLYQKAREAQLCAA
jgi:ABC-type polysaccharide/polyol phosphate transport system ATPase subunit